MATIKIDASDLLPALLQALQDPSVRAALVIDRTAPAATARYMTDEVYGARLGVEARTVRKWRAKGLPHIKIGGVVRVRVAEGDLWLESGGNVGLAVRRTLRAIGGGR